MQEVDNRTRSADELIVSVMNNSTPPQVDLSEPPAIESNTHQESENPAISTPEIAETPKIEAETPQNGTDEYGNPIKAEPEMISMEEHKRRLNEIMRQRTKNWSHEDQQRFMQQQNVPQNVPHGTQEPAAEGDWQQELQGYIEKGVESVIQRAHQTSLQQQQAQQQADFEIKFNQSAERYQDFESVVLSKPITPTMMRATMGMQDPAAFMYAAAKNHATEIERIAQIADPVSQATEIGRLEERMRRARATTSAPAPISSTKGDLPSTEPKRSIEDLINQDAKNRRRR